MSAEYRSRLDAACPPFQFECRHPKLCNACKELRPKCIEQIDREIHYSAMAEALDGLVCPTCDNRIGWNGDPRTRSDWRTCATCKPARAALSLVRGKSTPGDPEWQCSDCGKFAVGIVPTEHTITWGVGDEAAQITYMAQVRICPDCGAQCLGHENEEAQSEAVHNFLAADRRRLLSLVRGERQPKTCAEYAEKHGFTTLPDISELDEIENATVQSPGSTHPSERSMETKQAERLLNVARGCFDYCGGYMASDLGIYHHGIQTVINALEAAAKNDPSDMQVNVLERIGAGTPPSDQSMGKGQA